MGMSHYDPDIMVPVKCSTMNGISSKSLKTLEFDKVVDRLAAKTETTVGRELTLGLQPSTDYQEVLRRQRLRRGRTASS